MIQCKNLALTVGQSTASIKIINEKFDHILFSLTQSSTTNKLLIANLDKLWVKLTAKLPSGSEKIIDAKFIDLMSKLNYDKGYPGSDTEFQYQAKLFLGTVYGYEECTLQFSLDSGITVDSSPAITCETQLVDDRNDYPVNCFESITLPVGTSPLTGVVNLYQTSAGSDRSITINDPHEGKVVVNDSLRIVDAKCSGQYEVNQTTPFALIWWDKYKVGQNISIQLPASLNFLQVSRL